MNLMCPHDCFAYCLGFSESFSLFNNFYNTYVCMWAWRWWTTFNIIFFYILWKYRHAARFIFLTLFFDSWIIYIILFSTTHSENKWDNSILYKHTTLRLFIDINVGICIHWSESCSHVTLVPTSSSCRHPSSSPHSPRLLWREEICTSAAARRGRFYTLVHFLSLFFFPCRRCFVLI